MQAANLELIIKNKQRKKEHERTGKKRNMKTHHIQCICLGDTMKCMQRMG